jgi:hypothetical protein
MSFDKGDMERHDNQINQTYWGVGSDDVEPRSANSLGTQSIVVDAEACFERKL